MFERPKAGERSILVQIAMGRPTTGDAAEEFQLLAEAAGAEVVGTLGGSRDSPDPRLFIGSGKADELKALVAAAEAELVIFDHALSPAQERNLERLLSCRVVDRSGLILDIFAQRARSADGKLQVELAQLRHLSTRLVRGWTHLERQKGGIGLRGPGETQLETDRRLLGRRIALLNERLANVETQRGQGRRARDRAEIPTVSLVGYTNAGKSTLFNQLTEAGVYQADQLFATLDPTLRRLRLPAGPLAVLADTVGFINGLPHELVAAFRSTLRETREASLLLHLVDAASPERDRRIRDVEAVLAEIGAQDCPQLLVYNKIDLVEDQAPRLDRDAEGRVWRVWLSAQTGAGVELLTEALSERLRGELVQASLLLGPTDGALRAWLFEHASVLDEVGTDEGGWRMEVELARQQVDRHLDADPGWQRCLLECEEAVAEDPRLAVALDGLHGA
ncbi:MAG: ribosome rescue GTPase HflX [Lamprobacter sp.]|uniref:ribosome rescue GTPase HflX n=1 Tax=Lamprobacter sp. TaxID=3100796 RepID=UPI002B25F09A|nr:ribosome rescue GTPase HflX [Lamprobacter sp.]MEA3638589.1 ribosome rescue GTPase HflX [Lamprobacter sp.]